MYWNNRSPRDLPALLDELSSCLRSLSVRVRASVAEAVGSTVGRAVQDGLSETFATNEYP